MVKEDRHRAQGGRAESNARSCRPERVRWFIGACALASVPLFLVAGVDFARFFMAPNPMVSADATGMPPFAEPPSAAGAPWVLDPVSAWSAEEQRLAAQPCGRLAVLYQRYPVWAPPGGKAPSSCRPDAIRAAEATLGTTASEGVVLEVADDGRVVIERRARIELSIDERGLVVGRRR